MSTEYTLDLQKLHEIAKSNFASIISALGIMGKWSLDEIEGGTIDASAENDAGLVIMFAEKSITMIHYYGDKADRSDLSRRSKQFANCISRGIYRKIQ